MPRLRIVSQNSRLRSARSRVYSTALAASFIQAWPAFNVGAVGVGMAAMVGLLVGSTRGALRRNIAKASDAA